jgi:hypothetical protein
VSEDNGHQDGGATEEVTLILTRSELRIMLKLAEEVTLPAPQTKMVVASFQVKGMAALEAE